MAAPSSAAAAPAGAAFRPCRIGVGGVWPTGYAGVLSRAGLPREVLLDYQLADPEVLSKFDLVIIAGVPIKIGAACRPAIERLLAKGGSVFIDGSATGSPAVDWLGARFEGNVQQLASHVAQSLGFGGLASRPMFLQLAGDQNPLADAAGKDGRISSRMYWGFTLRVTDPATTEVLANFGDAAGTVPGLVLQKEGAGRVLLCGGGVGVMCSHDSVNFDRLILSVVRFLTNGKAVPQVEPDGPRLVRHQSLRSARLLSGKRVSLPADSGAVAERPAGPGTRGALPQECSPLEADPAAEFNVSGQADGEGELLLNYWNAANLLRVELGPKGIRIARVVGGRSRVLASAEKAIAPGTSFVIKERESRLLVQAGETSASAPLDEICRGAIAGRGKVGGLRYQPVEPVWFSDDFMRTSGETGGWQVGSGSWNTAPQDHPDTSANPFCYRVVASKVADTLYGYPFWDEYRASVAVRPDEARGVVGLGAYATDERNLLLFQARVRQGSERPADGFSLLRLVDGKPRVLAQCAGGVCADQWYRLQMAVRGGEVTAAVDGIKVLSAEVPGLTGGRIALHAENTLARFDDVLVEPAENVMVPTRQLVGSLTPTTGFLDLDTWAGASAVWEADGLNPGQFWRRGCFFGPVELRYDLDSLPANAQTSLTLDGDAVSPNSGYAFVLAREGGEARAELRRNGRVLARASGIAPEKLELSLSVEGNRVFGEVNGRALVSAPYSSMGRGRLGFGVSGYRPKLSGLAVYTANAKEYTFNAAPVEWWVGSGKWDLLSRWSCESQWSWYGCAWGAESAIWHKRPVVGDVVMDVYLGSRSPEGRPWWEDKTAQFNAVLCGDGKSTGSGYSFVVGDDESGARLLRNGKVVAENKAFRWFAWGHNRWANVRVEKHGDRVELFVEQQLILQYRDPQPLSEGYPAIWTHDNAIVVPAVMLYYPRFGESSLSLQ